MFSAEEASRWLLSHVQSCRMQIVLQEPGLPSSREIRSQQDRNVLTELHWLDPPCLTLRCPQVVRGLKPVTPVSVWVDVNFDVSWCCNWRSRNKVRWWHVEIRQGQRKRTDKEQRQGTEGGRKWSNEWTICFLLCSQRGVNVMFVFQSVLIGPTDPAATGGSAPMEWEETEPAAVRWRGAHLHLTFRNILLDDLQAWDLVWVLPQQPNNKHLNTPVPSTSHTILSLHPHSPSSHPLVVTEEALRTRWLSTAVTLHYWSFRCYIVYLCALCVCVCVMIQVGFAGTACEDCAPGRYGPTCSSGNFKWVINQINLLFSLHRPSVFCVCSVFMCPRTVWLWSHRYRYMHLFLWI